MRHMRTTKSVVTTFDFSKMASSHNNYNDDLIHPMNQTLKFVAHDGSSCELYVGQIATLVAAACKMPNPGKAIDYMLNALDKNDISEICGKY